MRINIKVFFLKQAYIKLNNILLTKSSTKCHHMVNDGSQSCIVSCVHSLFLTTAWLSLALHLQTHCMWCSHQPWAQGPFVICHDCVRNELMCLGLWKTSIERRGGVICWRHWFVVGVSDTINGSQTLTWCPHLFVTGLMLALTTTSLRRVPKCGGAEEGRFLTLHLASTLFLTSTDGLVSLFILQLCDLFI